MAPRNNRKNVRDSAIAQKGEVPNDLVGRRYLTFTQEERDYVDTYREIHKLCLACGAEDHPANSCSRAPNTKPCKQSTTGSTTTMLAHRPKPQQTERSESRVAVGEADRVPYHLVGIPYRDMTKDQRDEVFNYRKSKKLCTSCGDPNHRKYDCEVRTNTIERAMAKKKADILSGKLVLKTELTGPFAKLPVELQFQIFEDALKEDKPVDFRRGVLYGMCLIPGLHMLAIQTFFKVNTIKISSGEAMKAFSHMIKTFGIQKQIRALHFSSFGHFRLNKFGEGNPSYNGDLKLMRQCPNLIKIKLTFRASSVCQFHNYDDFYNTPVEPEILVKQYELMKLFKLKSLKAICFDGVDEEHVAAEAKGESLQGMWDLARWIDSEFKRRGKDVWVNWTARGMSWTGPWIYKPDEKWEAM